VSRRTTAQPGPLRAAARALPAAALLLLTALVLNALVLATPAAAAGAAPAAPLGMTPATGSVQSVPVFTTSAPCPSGTDDTYVQLLGGSFPAEGQVVRDISPFGSTTQAFSLRGSRSVEATALDARFVELEGALRAELVCASRLGERLAVFAATFTVADGRYAVDSPAVPAAPAAGRLDGQPVSLDEAAVPGAGGEAGAVPGAPVQPGDAAPEAAAPEAAAPEAAAGPDSPAEQSQAAPAGAASADGGDGSGSSALVGALLGGGAVAAVALLVPAVRRSARSRAGAPAGARP
jgi:hypothetical protein